MRWSVAFALLTLAGPAAATPPKSPAACVALSESAQTKRDDGHLLDSRADFSGCADDACPLVVRQDCIRWLADVEVRTPTLVVVVRDARGKDVSPVEVTVDDRAVDVATGRPFPVDPGTHAVRARAGAAFVEERVVMVEREKGRMITLTLNGALAVPPTSEAPAPAVAPSPPPSPPVRGVAKPVPMLTWIFAGVATAGAASFAYFWSTGISKLHDLRAQCAPACDPGEADRMRTTLWAGRVSLGISLAAAIGATIAYIVSRSPAKDAAAGSLARPFAF
jgi:hypothetical protein